MRSILLKKKKSQKVRSILLLKLALMGVHGLLKTSSRLFEGKNDLFFLSRFAFFGLACIESNTTRMDCTVPLLLAAAEIDRDANAFGCPRQTRAANNFPEEPRSRATHRTTPRPTGPAPHPARLPHARTTRYTSSLPPPTDSPHPHHSPAHERISSETLAPRQHGLPRAAGAAARGDRRLARGAGRAPRIDDVLAREAAPGRGDGGAIGAGSRGRRRRDVPLGKLGALVCESCVLCLLLAVV